MSFLSFHSKKVRRKKAEKEILELNQSLEQKVQKRTIELEEAFIELEGFSYSVSHDLRAPLRAIIGYSCILEEEYYEKFDEAGKKIIETIIRNTTKMRDLIDDILSFSKISRKDIVLKKIDMNVMFNQVYNELKMTCPERKIKFDIQSDLPKVKGDGAMIKLLVTNLLSNSIKFTSKKDNATIKITYKQAKGFVIFSVSDNGVGFDDKYKDKLFGVFQRLHSEKEFPGTGVGLAIAQRIVKKHDGEIWGEGKPGKGAVFSFKLKTNNKPKENEN